IFICFSTSFCSSFSFSASSSISLTRALIASGPQWRRPPGHPRPVPAPPPPLGCRGLPNQAQGPELPGGRGAGAAPLRARAPARAPAAAPQAPV
ncbi:hypothetical protein H8958_007133, partial [Nasalis larvatus]